jgi:allantoicase
VSESAGASHLVDLAAERLGGAVLAANDEFFAPKENLLKAAKPVFVEDKYTDRGKWMDGWETRRRRTPGHDWCIVRLGLAGVLREVVVDTSFFRGNYPESCSLEACAASRAAPVEELTGAGTRWAEVLPKSRLAGDTQNRFALASPHRFTHLRLNIFPDGGVARLRVLGEVVPDWKAILAGGEEIDLVAVQHGGRVVACSDMFFSAPQNLLLPGRGAHMGDGWETRRRRGPGFDWVILRLGVAGALRRVEVDTAHFKGNSPESCSLEACDAAAEEAPPETRNWAAVLPRTPLQPDHRHALELDAAPTAAVTHVRFSIYPDGGVSRLRLFGVPTAEGRATEGLRWLNTLLDDEARAALLDCCGSTEWAHQMAADRAFLSVEHLLETSDRVWAGLGPDDWREAFGRHPRIGERKAAGQSETAGRWSADEQSSASAADTETLAALDAANRAYERRFGYLFIVCATGKTTGEMLALLNQRLAHDPHTELRIAAEEQRKITRLRLEKLIRQ